MKLILRGLILSLLLAIGCKSKNENEKGVSKQPNIVVIYLDDLGFGDVGAYGATQLKTPNMDYLINNGVKFTNGYATSATCTPSRYSLLTGTYPWRNKSAKILPGTAPLIIDTAQTTIPKMLRKQGYTTGIVGKWHLGLGTGHVNWNEAISPGPNQVGFDYSFIMAATQDRVPTVYINNGEVVGLDPKDLIQVDYNKNFEGQPTGKDHPELCTMMWHHGHNGTIINGIPRIGFMKGGEQAKWQDTTMAEHFLAKAQSYVKSQKNNPFFLYYAMQQPHVPRTPNPRFVGATSMGPRGDAIAEADWCIGELINTLREEGLLDNTLIVFSSDNGPVLNDGYYDDAIEKLGSHKPAGPLRGGKYSLFEAGTHVPFAVFWQDKIKPQVSDALVCQMDLLNALAELTGSKERTKDGFELFDVFMGKGQQGRKELIIEAASRTALRYGDWVMIPPYDMPAVNKQVNIELGNSKKYQLYNLKDDIGQHHNLAETRPKKLKELIKIFKEKRGDAYKNIEGLGIK